jgi:hypothetical protein
MRQISAHSPRGYPDVPQGTAANGKEEAMTILRSHDEIEHIAPSFWEQYAPQLAGGLIALVIFALMFVAFVR